MEQFRRLGEGDQDVGLLRPASAHHRSNSLGDGLIARAGSAATFSAKSLERLANVLGSIDGGGNRAFGFIFEIVIHCMHPSLMQGGTAKQHVIEIHPASARPLQN